MIERLARVYTVMKLLTVLILPGVDYNQGLSSKVIHCDFQAHDDEKVNGNQDLRLLKQAKSNEFFFHDETLLSWGRRGEQLDTSETLDPRLPLVRI